MSRTNDPASQGQNPSATENLRNKASEVGEDIREMGGQARQAAKEKYEDLREQASEYYEQGREKAREWGEDVEGYVRDQPVKSLLIAAGIGFLLGAIWKRS